MKKMRAQLLDNAIKKSGLTKTYVAQQMTVSKETVTRHCRAITEFSMQDAAKYAEILNVPQETLLFGSSKLKLWGHVVRNTTQVEPVSVADSTMLPWRVTPPPEWRAVLRKSSFPWLDNNVIIIDVTDAEKQNINPIHYQKLCLVKITKDKTTLKQDGKVYIGVPYPDVPGALNMEALNGEQDIVTQTSIEEQTHTIILAPFGLSKGQTKIENVQIDWIVPVLFTVYRHELTNPEFIFEDDEEEDTMTEDEQKESHLYLLEESQEQKKHYKQYVADNKKLQSQQTKQKKGTFDIK